MKKENRPVVQKQRRFRVTDDGSGRIVAIVEAPDTLQAHQRFERVRVLVREIERVSCSAYSVEEQSPDVLVRCCFFSDGYFEVLDSSERHRHPQH